MSKMQRRGSGGAPWLAKQDWRLQRHMLIQLMKGIESTTPDSGAGWQMRRLVKQELQAADLRCRTYSES
jgi:hypothetical protein